jgi:hypothetical protein
MTCSEGNNAAVRAEASRTQRTRLKTVLEIGSSIFLLDGHCTIFDHETEDRCILAGRCRLLSAAFAQEHLLCGNVITSERIDAARSSIALQEMFRRWLRRWH